MRRTIPLDRLEGLPAPDQGLSTEQVQVRAARYGRNLILETVGSIGRINPLSPNNHSRATGCSPHRHRYTVRISAALPGRT